MRVTLQLIGAALGAAGLVVLAILLCIAVFPVGLAYALVESCKQGSFRATVLYWRKFLYTIALSIDMLGNVVCAPLLNRYLIEPGAYRFGRHGETISSVLGKAKRDGKLTDKGRWLADLLNRLDANHVEKSIMEVRI